MAVQKFDRTTLKVGQVFIIGLNVLAFGLGYVLSIGWAWVLVPLVGLNMAAGVVNPNFNLFRQFYMRVLKPAGVLKPNVAEEDPTPHQFAQGVGATFLMAATVAFLFGATAAGWVLTWIVIVLSFINFAFDFCVGCQVYFQLDRFNLIPRRG